MKWEDLKVGDVLHVDLSDRLDIRVITLHEPTIPGSDLLAIDLVNLQTGKKSEHVRRAAMELSGAYSVLRGADFLQLGHGQ